MTKYNMDYKTIIKSNLGYIVSDDSYGWIIVIHSIGRSSSQAIIILADLGTTVIAWKKEYRLEISMCPMYPSVIVNAVKCDAMNRRDIYRSA